MIGFDPLTWCLHGTYGQFCSCFPFFLSLCSFFPPKYTILISENKGYKFDYFVFSKIGKFLIDPIKAVRISHSYHNFTILDSLFQRKGSYQIVIVGEWLRGLINIHCAMNFHEILNTDGYHKRVQNTSILHARLYFQGFWLPIIITTLLFVKIAIRRTKIKTSNVLECCNILGCYSDYVTHIHFELKMKSINWKGGLRGLKLPQYRWFCCKLPLHCRCFHETSILRVRDVA